MIDRIGSTAYDAFCKTSAIEDPINLPVEVKQNLSGGEKQIFIMALYQALYSLNHVSVPYVIDTPFARIDTEHRRKILKNFFMKLKGQIIILSTDEEIVGPYKSLLEEAISDTPLL
jgi:DNA sulfur modification protein DndD